MRIRSVKPEFFTHPEVVACTIPARLLLIALFDQADDDGRLYDQPRKIDGNSFGENDGVKTPELLEELNTKGRILRYEAEGKKCIQILNFSKHQAIAPSKHKPSTIPPPPKRRKKTTRKQQEGSTKAASSQAPGSDLDARKGVEGNQERSGEESFAPKKPAHKELFDAVARVCEIDTAELTESSRGQLARAAKELRGAKATPTSIFQRAKNYRLTYPGMSLTPSALAKHWPQLERAQPPPTKDHAADIARSLMSREEDSNGSVDTTAHSHGRSLPQGSRG